MTEFFVTEVVDGDTFKVRTNWEWNGRSGDTVRPAGYDTPESNEPGYEEAKEKLTALILNKWVDIKNCQTIDRDRLVADVYYDGRNLADYFPEYRV